MAMEIRRFEFTVPSGTPKTAPVMQDIRMPPREIKSIHVRVPPGPSGNLGFRLGASGVPIVPYNYGEWFVADDESFDFDLTRTVESGSWEIEGYNTGDYDHTVYLTFFLDPIKDDDKNPEIIDF